MVRRGIRDTSLAVRWSYAMGNAIDSRAGMGMDHALYTGDLDLGAVGTREELASVLQVIRLRADQPSLRALEARTRRGATPLSKTVIAEMLRGLRFPSETMMVAFLEACGVPDSEMRSWRRTWKRVAAAKAAVVRAEAAETAPDWQRQAGVSENYSPPGTAGTDVAPRAERSNAGVAGEGQGVGHVFISYVREDSRRVDRLQRKLEAAGIPVWRDTADLWPGEDWRAKIRRAITDNALVFVACFSRASLARSKSYQNEELILAIEQLRLRSPENPWLIPVRFDECELPDRDIGGGRTLSSIQRADLFGNRTNGGTARLVASVLRILGHSAEISATVTLGPRAPDPAPSQTQGRATDTTASSAAAPHLVGDTRPAAGEIRAEPSDGGDIDGARRARRSALREAMGKPTPTTMSAASAVLARRLRELRRSRFPDARLTQHDISLALSEDEPLGTSTLSAWENVRTPTIPSRRRLAAYARFFATDRSLEGHPHLVPLAKLTEAEDKARRELESELLRLREEDAGGSRPRGIWSFADSGPVSIICAELPQDMTGPLTSSANPNYTELQSFADLDALMELFGHIRGENLEMDISFRTPSQVSHNDLTGHIVLLGGVIWNEVAESLSKMVRLPVRQVADSRLDTGEIFVAEVDGEERQFWPEWVDKKGSALVTDVGMLARVQNPLNASRTLTICSGIHSRGVYGVVRSLTDTHLRESNMLYMARAFREARQFAILARISIIAGRVLTPDFMNPNTVLYQWSEE